MAMESLYPFLGIAGIVVGAVMSVWALRKSTRINLDADAECRALAPHNWRRDDGSFVKDTDTIRGCAPKDRIITNGTPENMGHEMAHQVERNCK